MIDRRYVARVLLIGAVALAAGAAAGHARGQVQVSYRAADVIYLDAGRADGLAVGEHLTTGGADLVVTHVARNSAACRVVNEILPVRSGDSAQARLWRPALGLPSPGPILPASLPHSVPGGAPLIDPLQPRFPGREPGSSSLHQARIDGYLTFDWEVFNGSGRSRDFERRVTRLDLRARGLGGDAHEVRFRMSGQSYASSHRDRIYEASFIRRLEGSPFNFSLGRLPGGPRIGYGPLDGSLFEFSLQPGLAMGGFYGSASEFASLAFDDSNRRYGIFIDYLNPDPLAARSVDLRMSGIREEMSGQASRDYLSFESRLGARDGRWSFHQSAELDLNTDWRYEMSGRHLQLSNFSLRLARRFDEGRRFSISYDRFQLYRTGDTRWLSDEYFDDRPRHALRASFSLGKFRGWRMSLGAGVRSRDDDPNRSYSLTARARSVELTPWRLTLSADLLLFSNPMSDGYTTRFRAVRPLKNHRRLYVDLGRRQWQSTFYEDSQSAHWLRLGSDLELGRNLSVRGEYEVSSGDALAGNRFLMGLRYRIRNHP